MVTSTCRRVALAVCTVALATCVCAAPIKVAPSATLPQPGVFTNERNPSPDVPVNWELLGDFPIVGIHLANIPGSDQWVMVNKGAMTALADPALEFTSGSIFLDTMEWKNASKLESNAFCGGMGHTSGRDMVMVGGHSQTPTGMPSGHKKIRMYHPDTNTWPDTQTMEIGRWYPTTTLMPNKKVFIIGGTDRTSEFGKGNPNFEIYDPQEPTAPTKVVKLEPEHLAFAGQNYYPFTWVLPTGHLFNLIDRRSRVITQDGEYVKNADGSYVEAPETPGEWDTGFPRSGTAVMLALTPENDYKSVDIVVFGGQKKDFECPHVKDVATTALAGHTSYRITISWEEGAGGEYKYTFGDWVEEDMGLSRVGGESVLLPNGDVIVSGGAQTGCMGGTLNNVNRAGYPNMWPELYQPDSVAGKRYTIMEASDIVRVYHHTAGLTSKGDVIVTGCDACNKNTLESAGEWWDPSPKSKNEFRIEIFHTPYSLDNENKPKIVSVDGNTDGSAVVDLAYGAEFDIAWDKFWDNSTEEVKVTSVALVAPSTSTHSFNNNQRVVNLAIVKNDAQTVTVKAPPNANVAPPQHYMLFLNNEKTYSHARWVRFDTA